ncbi:MAG TPA: HAD family hydrolase, partial [bacterium]|nr:HAD family hydrolase [bacterium]
HPEWKSNPAFQAIEKNDHQALAALGHKPLMELVAVANTGMSTEEYEKTIRAWIDTAKHPRFKRLYKDLTYQPMKEVLAYLRAKGFKTFIVSGGGIEFMRPWTEQAYGVPPEQVVGSSIELKYELRDGKPALIREPKIHFVDDGPGKPVGIFQHIGRRPIAAFGNSDGDLQMLQWTAAGSGPSLMMLVHHDDAEREYAYDRESKVGTLNKAWDEAVAKGWTVISMKEDWNRIFGP